jgi:hypothetical protein
MTKLITTSSKQDCEYADRSLVLILALWAVSVVRVFAAINLGDEFEVE